MSAGHISYSSVRPEDTDRAIDYNVRVGKLNEAVYKTYGSHDELVGNQAQQLLWLFEQMEDRVQDFDSEKNRKFKGQEIAQLLIMNKVVELDFETNNAGKEELDDLYEQGLQLVA